MHKNHRFQSYFLPREGRKLRTNHYMFYTCVFVILLFAALIGYLIHFLMVDSREIISNPYNLRTENLKKQILRGKIISADGEILASSTIDEQGVESRTYPYGNTFAHVVGYAIHGKGGLESMYNYDLLTSHADIMTQIKNGVTGGKNPGDSLVTTLDTTLQKVAYEALGDYKGSVIAIEPSTGKIRAMVSKPDFDPNTLEDIWSDIVNDSSSTVLLNRSTQGLYPPGSTYKVLTALEYLSEYPNAYDEFVYECQGETIVDSVKIHCYKEEEHGEESLEDAFANSCNTAFVTIGSKLDRKDYIARNEEFLFGQNISCDLSVAKSRFKISSQSDQSQIPQTVIGQGDTLMTPIHNALVMCAIANDGIMMRPMLVQEITADDGVSLKTYDSGSIMECDDFDAIKTLQKMLRRAVTHGTGHALNTDDYTVAGKTGTAENENVNAHAWFVGYSDVEDPDLVVCVIVENTGAGSKYAAPIARKVFDAYYEHQLDQKYQQ